MPKKNHRIPADVKQEALEKIKNQGISVIKAADEYGVSTKTIYKWMSKNITAPPTIREFAKLKKENQTLLEIIGKLTVDLPVLEKKDAH